MLIRDPHVLSCPVCGHDLSLNPTAAICPNNHSFDRARTGYVNLLLSHNKQSAEPGDSVAMMRSRRAFLQTGAFDPIADALQKSVATILIGRTAPQVADLGCGEGFFTARLKNAPAGMAEESSLTCYGIDISRAGIKMASTYDREIVWIVASLHRSPFRLQSLDVTLSVFAPINPIEVRRIIRDDGALVTVTPGPDHLDGLRKVIYPSVTPHPETPSSLAGVDTFERTQSIRVRYPIVLDSAARIMTLLAMTPYYWNISLETKARVEALSRLELLVDVYVTVFEPRSR